MAKQASLTFVEKPAEWKGAALIAHLKGEPATKKALLEELARALSLPGHFGRNWDALEESLREFSWAQGAKSIGIVHHALPALPEDDLRIYLDILAGAVADLHAAKDGAPTLHAVFPLSARARIGELLA